MPSRRRRVPVALIAVTALAVVAGSSYVVEPGDTLSAIAARVGASVRALVDANDISDPDRIRAGEELRLPAASTGDETAPAAATPEDRAEIGRLIDEVAREYGWDPAFVRALAWQESGWQTTRGSSAGAVGIMQVMPETGAFVSERLVGRTLDLDDPRDNVTAGVAFLDHLYDLTDGDAEATLAGYYQGLASVRRNGRYEDTDRYIANVLALRDRFRQG